eukprot:scaffold189299_cov19-Tisochrysis_lutea.AAC.2
MGEAYHPEEAKRAVAQAEYFLKDGFQGNRTISSAWHTVLAMGSAYPLLLSDSIAYAAALGNGDAKCALEAWLYQVCLGSIDSGRLQCCSSHCSGADL